MAFRETKQGSSAGAGPAENKMGTMPVRPLVISMSLPMMASMLVQALYNIADSFFVARLSQDALSAVTVAFPMQNLMIAVASGTGVGVNALLSRSLGEKRQDRADNAANMGLVLAFFSYLLFLLVGLFAVKPFVYLQTANPQIREYAVTYTTIVCCVSIGIFFQVMLERLLQSTGRTTLSMVSQMTGAVINTIFDPIMIFGLFGFPRLGIAGAAIATVFGQCCASCLGLILNLKYNKEIRLSLKKVLHPQLVVIHRIYAVGLPSILMVSIGSIMTFSMNRLLSSFTDTATAVFGAYFKLQSFFFMPVLGINNGTVPILAYNYGAKRKDRIRETISFSIKLALGIMICGMLLFETIPGKLLSIFSASEELLAIGIPALRRIGIHFPIAACSIILVSSFQAFSRSIYSLIISICRQLIVLIPCAWLLSLTGNINNIWWCFALAEIMSITLCIFFFRKISRELEL